MPRKTMPPRSAGGAAARQRIGATSQADAALDAEAAQTAANSYCLCHYGVRITGGPPRRLQVGGRDLWIVPAVFTSPGYGIVGEVGLVAVDAMSGEVVGATPREEASAAGAKLAQEKQDEIRAAFARARKGE
jgi:hypothetical protein